MPCHNENVMSDLDTILDILERNNSASKLRPVRACFSGWEYVLQYPNYSKSQFGRETVEDEMGVGFAHSPPRAIGNIMA